MPADCKKLTVQIVLCGWLLANAQPAQAQQNKPEPGKTDQGEAATRLDKIERQLGDLHTGLKGLKELLEGVTKQLETYDLALRVQKNAHELAALREEVDRLQKELTKAQAALGRDRTAEPRKAMSPPELLPAPGGRVAVAQGQVELINEWLTPISVWVDDLLYQLRPGERRVIAKSAGTFNYEVTGAGWGLIQPRRTTTVASGETLTIRIVPR